MFTGSDEWRAMSTPESDLYRWDEKSTYIQEPPFFVGLGPGVDPSRR